MTLADAALPAPGDCAGARIGLEYGERKKKERERWL